MSTGASSAGLSALYPHIVNRLSHGELFKTVAVLGSGPAAPEVEQHLSEETFLVTVNNSWRAAPWYDVLVYSDDLPDASKPSRIELNRRGRSSPQYWTAMQACGGILYCGATLAFAAGYWVLHNLPSSQVSYFASDMTYGSGPTHFYGNGSPDPLRTDISLQDIVAKGLRLFYFGLRHNCLLLNASAATETRLPFPRVRSGRSLRTNVMQLLYRTLQTELESMESVAREALALEAAAPFDARVADYSTLMASEVAWSHAASVDAAWRRLAPLVERIGPRVELVFAELPDESSFGDRGLETARKVKKPRAPTEECMAACGALLDARSVMTREVEKAQGAKLELEAKVEELEERTRELGERASRVERELLNANATVDRKAELFREASEELERLRRDYDVLDRSAGITAVRALKKLPWLYPAFLAAKRRFGRATASGEMGPPGIGR